MAPSEMAPARPLRGGAGSGRAAATTTRPQGALPGSAQADKRRCPAARSPSQRAEQGSPSATGTPPAPESSAAAMRSVRPPIGLCSCFRAGRGPERPPCARHNPQEQLAPGTVTTGGRGKAAAAAASPPLERTRWRCGTRVVPAGQRGQWPSEGPQQQPRRRHTGVLHAALSPFHRQPLRTPRKPWGHGSPWRLRPHDREHGPFRTAVSLSVAERGTAAALPAQARPEPACALLPPPSPPRRPRPHGAAGCAYLRPPPAPPRTGEKGEQPRPPPRTSTSATRDWPRHRPPRGAAAASLGEAAARQHRRRRRNPHRPP